MASFVLTPTETASVQQRGDGTTYWIESLSVEFTTTEEFVRSVLPPCFSPAKAPTGRVSIATYRRADGAGRTLEFDATTIYIDAEYEGIPGLYSLTMLVSGDMAITLGREISGEIKKRGDSRIYSNGRTVYAYGSRKDTRIVEIEANLGPDQGPSQDDYLSLELKATPTPLRGSQDGYNIFHVKPSVVVMRTTDDNVVTRTGTATLKLNPNGFDPVESIPLVSVGTATFAEGTSLFRCDRWVQLEGTDDDAYAPYVFGRQYDYPRV